MLATRAQALELSMVFSQSLARRRQRPNFFWFATASVVTELRTRERPARIATTTRLVAPASGSRSVHATRPTLVAASGGGRGHVVSTRPSGVVTSTVASGRSLRRHRGWWAKSWW